MNLSSIVLLLTFLIAAYAAGPAEDRASAYFEKVRHQPSLLRAFLQQMPKGGDLHIHLEGSVYVETLIELAAKDRLCVDRNNVAFTDPPCDAVRVSVSTAQRDPALYAAIIDGMSMRNFVPGRESAQDHF